MAETLGGILAGQPSGISPRGGTGQSLGLLVGCDDNEEYAEAECGAGV